MGICCKGSNIDNDIENYSKNNQIDKNQKDKSISSLVFQEKLKYNEIENIHKVNTNSEQNNLQKSPKIILEKNIYISKNKLKLIVKQSKCLLEGKEYIINSLGLIDPDNKNNYQDGLVIFGDINVS